MADRIKEVEAEYGLPFWDVVRGFADDGESIYATANILNMPGQTLYSLVIKNDRREWFRPPAYTNGRRAAREARRDAETERMRYARSLAMQANPTYRRIELDGVTDTIAGHCRRLGINGATVAKRLRDGVPVNVAFLNADLRLLRARRTKPDHPWLISNRRHFAVLAARRGAA